MSNDERPSAERLDYLTSEILKGGVVRAVRVEAANAIDALRGELAEANEALELHDEKVAKNVTVLMQKRRIAELEQERDRLRERETERQVADAMPDATVPVGRALWTHTKARLAEAEALLRRVPSVGLICSCQHASKSCLGCDTRAFLAAGEKERDDG